MKPMLTARNPHKATELRTTLLPPLPGAQILGAETLDVPEPVEDEVTFADNALTKAGQLAGATGLLSLADNSGICVGAMGGAPGVFSAWWCGRHSDDVANLELLLAQMADVPEKRREVSFVRAAAIATPGGREEVAEGVMRGSLLLASRGENGSGYNPIFRPEGFSVSSAELTPERKEAISHCGKAFRALVVRT